MPKSLEQLEKQFNKMEENIKKFKRNKLRKKAKIEREEEVESLEEVEELIEANLKENSPQAIVDYFIWKLFDFGVLNRERLLKKIKEKTGYPKGKMRDRVRELIKETYEEEGKEENSEQPLEDLYDVETVTNAKKMLKNQHILKKVKTVLDYKIAGEDRTKLGLFLQLLTKDFEEPLMIYGIQKQGEGKSFIAKNVLELFPERMVINVTDMTKASLYRLVEKESKNYFDGKIVYFGEVPEQEEDRTIFQIFRQLVSEGKVSKILVMEKNGEKETTKLELEGAPAMISTTIDAGRINQEDMSRGVTYSPSMDPKQYEVVREFQNCKESLPEEAVMPKEIQDLEEVVKCAVDMISRKEIKIKNPWVKNINDIIPEHISNIKRDYPKVLKIVGKVPTYLYHKQRVKLDTENNSYYLTDWKDIVRGLWINKEFINGMLEGRVKAVLDAFEVIKDKVERLELSFEEMKGEEEIQTTGFGNKDLESWMDISSQTARSYTRKLYKMGMIYKDDTQRPHKHYLPKESNTKNGGITLRALHNILAGFIHSEKLGEWANLYYGFLNIEGLEKKTLIEKIGINEENLPITVDFGLIGDYKNSSFHNPIYMKNTKRYFDVPKSLKLEMEGSNIMCGLRSVSKTIKKISSKDILKDKEDQEEGNSGNKNNKSNNGNFTKLDSSFEEVFTCAYCGETKTVEFKDEEGNYVCKECKEDMEA